jgi:hypothetical protein
MWLSACFHIQAVIAKKYFPKPLEGPPTREEPVARAVVLVAVLYHFGGADVAQVALMWQFEFVWAIARFALLALTEDGIELYQLMKTAHGDITNQIKSGADRFEESAVVIYPFEIFALIFLNLLLRGKREARLATLAIVLGFGFVAPAVYSLFGPKKAASVEPEKKKQDDETKKPKIAGEKKKDD